MEFKVTTGGSVPIYRQIENQIHLAIASGALRAGEQLPSVRVLAQELLINPNTVARAYNGLVRDGVLRSEKGRRLSVAERRSTFKKAEREERLRPALDAFVHQALGLEYTPEEIRKTLERRLSQLDLTSPGDGS